MPSERYCRGSSVETWLGVYTLPSTKKSLLKPPEHIYVFIGYLSYGAYYSSRWCHTDSKRDSALPGFTTAEVVPEDKRWPPRDGRDARRLHKDARLDCCKTISLFFGSNKRSNETAVTKSVGALSSISSDIMPYTRQHATKKVAHTLGRISDAVLSKEGKGNLQREGVLWKYSRGPPFEAGSEKGGIPI